MPINVSFPKVSTWGVGQAQWARLMETNFVSTAKQLDLIRTSVAQVKAAVAAVTRLGSVAALYVGGKPKYSFDASDTPYFQINRHTQGSLKLYTSIMLHQPPNETGSDFLFYVGQTSESGSSGTMISLLDMYNRIVDLETP